MIVVYEAAGLGKMGEYFVRTLVSEGHIRHEVTEKGEDGRLTTRVIEQEGPAGVVLTTTEIELYLDNETRMFSVTVTDTAEQTLRILLAQATQKIARSVTDLSPFLELQEWLTIVEHRVIVPFASTLARLVPLNEIRIRRDFSAVLGLIEAHAILHQALRQRDSDGRIIATLKDYAAVRELVNAVLGEGLETMVKPETRQTVLAVKELQEAKVGEITNAKVGERLKLSKSTALRRIRAAIKCGYLINLEEDIGRPANVILGDPLPNDRDALPDVATLTVALNTPET
jgi:hypothetical protein